MAKGIKRRAVHAAKKPRKPNKASPAGRKAVVKRQSAAPNPARKRRANGLFAGLKPNAANFAPLTPISFLPADSRDPSRSYCGRARRAEDTYRRLHERVRRLASALARHGVRPGDTVSAMLPNVPSMLEVHFGVPMLGAVLTPSIRGSIPQRFAIFSSTAKRRC